MTNKITLVTPPDFYENSNFSVLFLSMSEVDQDAASKWLGEHTDYPETNFYYYQGENNIPWLLYALNRADVKFLNFDTDHAIINMMGSYILGRPNVYYTTQNPDLKALMSHINNQFVPTVEQFLERVFNGQKE
ncbi:MAG: hypothetical protein WCP55_00845 [Lentisphaerota bacterium]